jgi:hypothetical protein
LLNAVLVIVQAYTIHKEQSVRRVKYIELWGLEQGGYRLDYSRRNIQKSLTKDRKFAENLNFAAIHYYVHCV